MQFGKASGTSKSGENDTMRSDEGGLVDTRLSEERQDGHTIRLLLVPLVYWYHYSLLAAEDGDGALMRISQVL